MLKIQLCIIDINYILQYIRIETSYVKVLVFIISTEQFSTLKCVTLWKLNLLWNHFMLFLLNMASLHHATSDFETVWAGSIISAPLATQNRTAFIVFHFYWNEQGC